MIPGGGARVLALDVGRVDRPVVRLVLKRHVNPVWIAMEPDMAEREARTLGWLDDAGVPAPRLVAVDSRGAACGTPAILMTRIPGRSRFRALERRGRLASLAERLLQIHALRAPAEARVAPYFRYAHASTSPPAWSAHRAEWRRAIAMAATLPPFVPTFIHRDYHPSNVLWRGDDIRGVIDWVNASIGPPQIDVGHFRANLMWLAGRRLADAWVEACVRAGVLGDYNPRWDLVIAVDFLSAEWMSDRDRRALERLMLAGLGPG